MLATAAIAPVRAQSMSCDAASFARLGLPATRIVSAAAVNDDPRAGAHCMVRGVVNERTGTDGKPYAIGFEMRLPQSWNGRYFHQVNGGNDGAVVPAYGGLGGNQPDNALARGYATLSSDSGHDGQANRDAGLVGGNLFGFDHQARLDYGYAANVTLTPLAKTIVERYYGRRPEYSYMVGCSNGGRHAFVGATRLADEFDGFLAGAPGYNLPIVGLQHAWDVQSFDRANRDIRRAFSRDAMRVVADGVVAQCDALDGAADGMVGAIAACQRTFDPERLACGATVSAVYCSATGQGAQALVCRPDRRERPPLYTSWVFDAGFGSNDWRNWKLESAIPGFEGLPLIATLGAGSLAQVFTTPPTRSPGRRRPARYLRAFDFDRDAQRIEATTPRISRRGDGLHGADRLAATAARASSRLPTAKSSSITAPAMARSRCKRRSIGTEKLRMNNGGDVYDFARFYAVPAMTHCGGGPATDRFDVFAALVAWVEHGTAPGSLTAGAGRQRRAAGELEPRRGRGRSAIGRKSRAIGAPATSSRPRALAASNNEREPT